MVTSHELDNFQSARLDALSLINDTNAVNKIVAACGGAVSADILTAFKPEGSRATPLLEATAVLRSMRESPDLVRQFADWLGGNGARVGHSLQSFAITSNFFSLARRTGLPLVQAMWFIAIALRTVRGYTSTIKRPELVFAFVQDTHAHHCGARLVEDCLPLTGDDASL